MPFIDSQLRDSMHEFANISTSQPLISTSQIKRSNTANENETVGHKMSKIDEENIRISASKGDVSVLILPFSSVPLKISKYMKKLV